MAVPGFAEKRVAFRVTDPAACPEMLLHLKDFWGDPYTRTWLDISRHNYE